MPHGENARRVRGVQTDRAFGADDFELRHERVGQRCDGNPQEHDRHRPGADEPGRQWVLDVGVDLVPTHAVLSKHAMYPFTLSEDLSSLTVPLTVMRHLMVSTSPWARRSA